MGGPRAILNRVTITGADDRTSVAEMLDVATEFPFAEWGILFSERAARPRYPGPEWLASLLAEYRQLNLSAHVCGRWVRDICEGRWTLLAERPDTFTLFDRMQLNFRSHLPKINHVDFLRGLAAQAESTLSGTEFIFQLGSLGDDILLKAHAVGIDAVGVFDTSGGTGVLPDAWPAPDTLPPPEGEYGIHHLGSAGYAGGLSPDNLAEQLPLIAEKVGDVPVWIDVESKVRTDEVLDMAKVRRFLKAAEPWVIH